MPTPSVPAVNKDRLILLGKLKDITSRVNNETNPFLHILPELFERNILNPVTIAGYVTFAENAVQMEPHPLIKDSIRILNQLINPEDWTFIEPRPEMLRDNLHFTWKEFSTYTDPKSVISHIINKCALVLSLGK